MEAQTTTGAQGKKGLVVLVNRRTAKRMKPGVTLEYLRGKYPTMRFEVVTEPWPSMEELEEWSDGVCEATDGCRVEPDGECEHGHPSWLMALGYL